MKITITDKFLWDVYRILSKTGNVLSDAFKYPTMRNSLPGLKDPVFKKYREEKGAKEFSKLVYYLKRKGYIRIKNLESKKAIILTKGGIDKALKASFRMEKMVKRKDGKWVMVIFDVPEKNRRSRDLLRSILNNLGFKIYQKSVWISPFDVSEKLEKALQMYDLDSFVKIFIIEEI
jgi:hypothetical protein